MYDNNHLIKITAFELDYIYQKEGGRTYVVPYYEMQRVQDGLVNITF